MDKSDKFKVRLGIFVIAGLAFFALAIFLIGRQQNLFNPVFTISTQFRSVSGLQVGNNVRFSGINVGTVDNIEIINDTTVKVDMFIQKEIQPFIKKNSTVAIGSEGIIGDRILVISQGTPGDPEVAENQMLRSIEPIETDAIMASLKVTGENAEIASEQLAEILYKINYGEGILGRLIQDTAFAENIDQTLVNLRRSSKGLNENMEAAKHNILLRGYFKKKERKAEKIEEEKQKEEEKKQEEQKEEQKK